MSKPQTKPKQSPGMLVITPISKARAENNFAKTVKRPWTLKEIMDKIKKELGDDAAKTVERTVESIAGRLESTKNFAIWGAKPTVQGAERLINVEEDEGTQRIVAFYRKGRIICWGEIFAGVRSRELAEGLWGHDEKDGQTWEYVYFIKNLKCCEPGIPWDNVRAELGYSSGFTPRGHTFVEPSKLKDKYGGVSQFLESLASKSGCGEPGKLEVIGRALVGLSKKILKFEAAEPINPQDRLIEDLKRLGLVVEERSQSAGRGGALRASPLAVRAADAVKACLQCKSKVGDYSCYQVGGSVAVIELWASGAGSAPESVMKLAKLAMNIAKKALKDECIPLLYVPLNIESLSGS